MYNKITKATATIMNASTHAENGWAVLFCGAVQARRQQLPFHDELVSIVTKLIDEETLYCEVSSVLRQVSLSVKHLDGIIEHLNWTNPIQGLEDDYFTTNLSNAIYHICKLADEYKVTRLEAWLAWSSCLSEEQCKSLAQLLLGE